MNKLYLLYLLLIPTFSYAEDHRQWEKFFYEVATYGEETSLDEEDYEALCEMEEHPLNINAATSSDLEQLPFLTAQQVEDICEYIYRYGPMKTLAELQLISSLDYARRQLLLCFVVAGEQPKKKPNLKDMLANGRHELMVTVRQPLYSRSGDRNGYLGYNTKHSFRYSFDAHNKLRLGLLGAQDSGEPFFSEKNGMGYDHYSFYVQARDIGIAKNIIAGQFRVKFGLGLVANTGFSLGKTAMLTTMGRTTNAVSPSLSRSSAYYMQGVAATVSPAKRFDISAWASYRPIDATLNADDGTIATILTNGYHRTQKEMEKKNNSHASCGGLNLHYRIQGFNFGATAVYTHLDRRLSPNTTTVYKRYYAAGSDFSNFSVDYSYTSHVVAVSGETAISHRGNVATINTASVNVADGLSLMAIYRYYSHKYTSLYANSFCDAGRVQNENGVFLGLDWQPLSNLRLNAYADYAHSPWARYRVSRASDSFDTMVAAQWTPGQWTFSGRYRLRLRYRDSAEQKAMLRYATHRGRLSATYTFTNGWYATTQADFALTTFKTNDTGYMISQSAGGQWRWLKINASANYFHTDSYESRLYAYERGLLHTFAFPSFYGHGLRYALMVRADFGQQLMATVKIGVSSYFDRSRIGTGLQQINGSSMADVDLQLRWKF